MSASLQRTLSYSAYLLNLQLCPTIVSLWNGSFGPQVPPKLIRLPLEATRTGTSPFHFMYRYMQLFINNVCNIYYIYDMFSILYWLDPDQWLYYSYSDIWLGGTQQIYLDTKPTSTPRKHILLPLVNSNNWRLKPSFPGNVSSLTGSPAELGRWVNHTSGQRLSSSHQASPGAGYFENGTLGARVPTILSILGHLNLSKTGFYKNPTSEKTNLTNLDDLWPERKPSMWSTSWQIHSNIS